MISATESGILLPSANICWDRSGFISYANHLDLCWRGVFLMLLKFDYLSIRYLISCSEYSVSSFKSTNTNCGVSTCYSKDNSHIRKTLHLSCGVAVVDSDGDCMHNKFIVVSIQ